MILFTGILKYWFSNILILTTSVLVPGLPQNGHRQLYIIIQLPCMYDRATWQEVAIRRRSHLSKHKPKCTYASHSYVTECIYVCVESRIFLLIVMYVIQWWSSPIVLKSAGYYLCVCLLSSLRILILMQDLSLKTLIRSFPAALRFNTTCLSICAHAPPKLHDDL